MTKEKDMPRDLYFNQIEPYIGQGLIKVITGQCRVSKSYVLLQVMEEILKRYPDAHIIYINKEDYQFEAIKTHDHLMGYLQTISSPTEKYYLFIDEIQEIKNFEIALRSLQSVNEWDIYYRS